MAALPRTSHADPGGMDDLVEHVTDLATPPTPAERDRLAAFLASSDRTDGTLSLVELEGFLFAVAAAPCTVRPFEWLEIALGGELRLDEGMDEGNSVLATIFALYNAVNSDVRYGNGQLPATVVFRDEPEANLEPGAPLCQWSRGFAMGHFWLLGAWDEFGELPDEWHAAASLLLLFADRDFAEGAVEEAREEDPGLSLAESLAATWARFPHSLMLYSQTGVALHRASLAAMDPPRPVQRTPRPGRNDPCGCGSGRKYKKCCGGIRLV